MGRVLPGSGGLGGHEPGLDVGLSFHGFFLVGLGVLTWSLCFFRSGGLGGHEPGLDVGLGFHRFILVRWIESER